MAKLTVGLLHPGEMGSAVGACLTSVGLEVLWLPKGRSPSTRMRAELSGMTPVGSMVEVTARSSLILSICPPHAALDVARSLPDFKGTYVDANAISPSLSERVQVEVSTKGAKYVDGSIIGIPPTASGTTRLYLAGAESVAVAAIFDDTFLDARTMSAPPGAASALKMAYAAWTKGTAALLLAIRQLARDEEIEDALLNEWSISLPELPGKADRAAIQAEDKGWRWAGEMDEIASTFSAFGLPGGFHQAAAEVFRRGNVGLHELPPRSQ